jgi:hypothetical protein
MPHRALPSLLSCALCALVGCGGSDAGVGDGDGLDALVDSSPAIDGAVTDSSVTDATVRDASDATDAIATDASDTSTTGDAPDARTCAHCTAYDKPVTAGTITNAAATELSGLAASWVNDGTWWVHNDSGHGPSIYAIDSKGASLAELVLEGANTQDWEDLSVGPCPKGSCIYVGNIGDNGVTRTNCSVFRVAEPTKPTGTTKPTYETFPFKYPDGPRNAETLLVHPSTGVIYIVSKTDVAKAGAYRFPMPLTPGVEATLVRISDVTTADGKNHLFTGGDIHPCGDAVLLRLYDTLYEYRVADGAAFDTIFATTPKVVPAAREGQAEAVGYRRDGLGYFTTSEGATPPLSSVSCL